MSELKRSPLRRLRRQAGTRVPRRKITLAVVPAILTLGNGVCGMASIAVVTSLYLPWSEDTKLLVAGLLIFAGMLFDALDGSAARITGGESEFGGELDSLCDAITFGAAPAVIVWRFGDGQTLPPKLVWGMGVLFAMCVLIRLARFNVETDEDDSHEGFEGLPSPAAAGTLAAIAIAMSEINGYSIAAGYAPWVVSTAAWVLLATQYLMPLLALVLAALMVSRYQYPHLFSRFLTNRRGPNQIGQALFLAVGFALFHWLALPIAFLAYALGFPIRETLRGGPAGETPIASPGPEDDEAVRREAHRAV